MIRVKRIEEILAESVAEGLGSLYSAKGSPGQIQVQKTKREFEGDLTIVVFPLLSLSKESPEATGEKLGQYLNKQLEEVTGYNVVKGFLNLLIHDRYWLQELEVALKDEDYGFAKEPSGSTIMVEYSSPNTNKPLHLGHIRNNLLGWSLAEILKANGHNVIKTQIINDRGIHICKSMLAWQKWGNGETPESAGIKGDKLVGNYYVKYDQEYKKEVARLVEQGQSKEDAEQTAPLLVEAQEMLRKWEEGDENVRDLWTKMNNWVYKGFEATYKDLGVDFDKVYYESDTYLLGKDIVEHGLEKGILIKKEDGSVWCDLSAEGLDEKLLLRADGTSVYMTQDIGTAVQRFGDYTLDESIYVVGNEQNYHFKVLLIILKKLGYEWAGNCHHLSYGMVDLPSGKMKSREGTVVDADDLITEMVETAEQTSKEFGRLEEIPEEDRKQLYRIIGLGALKYFLLKVDPKKQMLFNPEESIDFTGNTGPFIQYTYARIQSVLRKGSKEGLNMQVDPSTSHLDPSEREILKRIGDFPSIVKEAGTSYSPSLIANYTYELVKAFNQFYQTVPILKADDGASLSNRLAMCEMTGRVIKSAMRLLGIDVPERM